MWTADGNLIRFIRRIINTYNASGRRNHLWRDISRCNCRRRSSAVGKKVIIVSPDMHLGGLSSGGLGFTDPIDLAKILKKHFTVHHAYIINNMIIRAMNILDLPINSPNEEACRKKTKN